MAIKAILPVYIWLHTLSSTLLSFVFWVTLPCAVQLIICAPPNGGKLMQLSIIQMSKCAYVVLKLSIQAHHIDFVVDNRW